MKKRLVALLVLALVMVLALTSCEFIQNIKDKINPPAEEYAVYFIVGEGASRVPAQTVKEGELVTKPTDPTFVGFVFGGWFKEEAFTTPWNFDTDKVERNTMIYAKWVECTEHSGGAATCTKGAVCEVCGKTYTEPLGHKGGAATCTEGAVCELCGKTYTEALGHKGGTATCEGKAVCEVCGKEYGDPLGHTPGEAVKENDVAPDCDTAGSYDVVVYCSVCGEELSRETVTVDALGHTEETIPAVDPDCTNTGLTEGKKCSVCGEVLVAQEPVDALGHTPGAPVKEHEVKGDCLTESSHDTVFYCSVCGEELQRDTTTVPAPGHKDENADDYCDACNEYLKSLENVHVNISDITSITDNTEFVPGTGIYNTAGMELDTAHSKALGCIAFNARLKLGGNMKPQSDAPYRGVKIVTNGPATIVVYAISSSSSATRALRLTTFDGTSFTDVDIDEGIIGTDIGRYEFTAPAEGTYYLGSKSSGINLYYIAILYTPEEHEHQCNNRCDVEGCGKCLNADCTETLCADKCPGHHECANVCEQCGKCTNAECKEPVCVDKCQGHHVCESKCEQCGKCLDAECTDSACANKCLGHHTACESVCPDCGKCQDHGCEDSICAEKCYCNYEEATYSLNVGDLEAGVRSADEINGKFTIVSGTEVRNRTKTYDGVEYTKSVKMAAGAIKVSVPGTGKLSFIVQNGSSGAAVQYVKVTAPDGTVSEVEIPGTDAGSPTYLVEIDVTKGDWTVQRVSGTIDVFYLSLTCLVEKSPETGFELVDDGKVDYILGEDLDTSKVVLNATYESGKTEPLAVADVTVDSSAFNKDAAGTYTITISYKNYTPITYTVTVYAPVSLDLGFDAVEKLAQSSSAGNGVYFNYSFKEVYDVNEVFATAGLSVTVVCADGEGTKTFLVPLDEKVAITGFDSGVVGKQTVTITYNGTVNTTVDVYVVDTAPAEVDGTYQAKVDMAYDGAIGAVVDGFNMFNTIQQALDFLARVDAGEKKLLVIGEGLFTEKLEITIPNLTIRGAGMDKTTIEWDSLYGLVDAGGFTHTTDSTATVAIRDAATNVSIEDITISNYWNTQERMDEAGLAIERGLALLVQADRFVMKNSRLLGIQDTLELFTGRQYFENVYISGYTDFIFGTNNTTYFKNCTVHVIDTAKDDGGTAGYITAFKGSNKGANDSIVYGAIFDGCKFTADEGVTAGKTAIGRTWGAYAAVAVINSELGGHISLDGYDKAENKNKRYISMNGIHPTDETVQFVEYNNTGAGAITEAVAGMRMLTAEEVAKYVDFATIFGTTNGKVSYLDAWDPFATEIVVDDRTYYYFNGQTGTSGTSYTYTGEINGATGTFGDIAIDATVGKVSARASDTQINAGAKLTFDVKAGTLVTVISYPGYGHYTLNGVAHYANDTFSQYYAEDTTVTLEATATAYIYQIIINPGEEAPEAPELVDVKVSGLNLNYTVGDELSLEGAVVKAYYSDYSVVTVSDYTVDASAVNNAAAGSYDIVFTYGGKTVTVTVTYEGSNADPAITEDITLDFSTPAGLEAVQNNPRVTIDGSVRHNGGEIQIQGTISFMVKAGTTIVVNPYANTQYASYTIGALGEENLTTYNVSTTYVAVEDCTVVYTGLSNNYLVSIVITMGADEEPEEVTYVLDAGNIEAFAAGAKADGDTEVINDYFKIHYSAKTKVEVKEKSYDDGYTATQRISWGGSSKVGSSIKNAIEFTVEAGATIKVWWASGDNSRTLDLVDANGTVISSVGSDAVKNALYINEFTVSEAGTYYLACLAGSNYIAKVEVTTTK